MHRFLRAIGFSKQYSKQEIDQLLGYVMNEPDYHTIIKSGKTKYVRHVRPHRQGRRAVA